MSKFNLKLTILFVYFCFNIINSNAQDTTNSKFKSESYYNPYSSNYEPVKYDNKIGISASWLSFYGINYQYYLTQDWRLSGTGIVYLFENSDNQEKEFSYKFGLQLHRIIIRDNRWNVYLLVGGGYSNYNRDRVETTYDYRNNVYIEKRENIVDDEININIGTGIGAGYQISKYIAIDIEIGYKYDSRNNERQNLTDLSIPTSISKYKSIVPFAGFGAYICF